MAAVYLSLPLPKLKRTKQPRVNCVRCPMCRAGLRQDNLAYEQWRENLHRHSYNMDSRSLQTGMFLHQFTNSVSKALHKDTARSKRFSAEELYAKANPAIFTATNTSYENGKGTSVQLQLPTISKLGATSNVRELITQSNRPLKVQVERTVKISKPAAATSPRDSDDNFRLPKIMEITDREGNNWKIQQQGDKNEKAQKNKLTDATNRVPARIPPIEPVLVHAVAANRSVTTDPIEAVRQSNNVNTSHPKLPHINKNKQLTWSERKQNHHPADDRSNSEDDFDDTNSWNDVRMSTNPDRFNPVTSYTKSFQNKMSYSNYLKQMSLPNVQGEDKTHKKRAEDAGKLHIQGTGQLHQDEPVKSLDVYCLQNHEQLSEKIVDELTPRHARTHKVEVGKHIPKNFTDKQKKELRSLYPMYDSKLQSRHRSLESYNGIGSYLGNQTPRKMPSLESLSTISSSSTANSSVQCKMFRIPSSLGQETLITKRSKRRNKKSPRDEITDSFPPHLKTVNFSDVYEYTGEDDELDLQASIEHAQYRENKGMIFTRQPPPTPVEKHDATSVKSETNEREQKTDSPKNMKSPILIEAVNIVTDEKVEEVNKPESVNLDDDKKSDSEERKNDKKQDSTTEVDFQTETENEKRTEHYSLKEDKLSVLVEVSSERYEDSNVGYPPALSSRKQTDICTVSENSSTTAAPSEEQTEKSRYVSLQPAIKTIEIPIASYSKYSTTLDESSDAMTPTAENNWTNKNEDKRKGVMSQQSSVNANVSTKDVVFVSPAAYVTKA
ncbi:uncharacterized protein LOC144452808 [Glandiceps talaboti]